jgi:hypothetical protein
LDLGTSAFVSGDGREEGRVQAATLLAIAAARQAASPTALTQARLPVTGVRGAAAFAGPVADAIARWGCRSVVRG